MPSRHPSRSSRSFFGPSLDLGSVAGIPIRVHWTFGLLILWSAFVNFSATGSVVGAAFGMLFVAAVFGCVVLHELGHSLTAMRFGIRTKSITLSPIGGVAALESAPKSWREELWVTAMGPAVNAAIALLLLPVVFLTATPDLLMVPPFSTPANFVFMLFGANVMLVLFNLIPAFPMDGGRLLRALLTPSRGKLGATRIASRIGQVCAVGMVVGGLVFSPFLVLIGVFVFLAAASERRSVEVEESLAGTTVSDAMRYSFETVDGGTTVDEAIRSILYHGQSALPVIEMGQLVGIVDFDSLVAARASGLGAYPVGNIVDRENDLSVSPHDGLLSALQRMQSANREVVPVVRESRLVGLLPKGSVLSVLALRGA